MWKFLTKRHINFFKNIQGLIIYILGIQYIKARPIIKVLFIKSNIEYIAILFQQRYSKVGSFLFVILILERCIDQLYHIFRFKTNSSNLYFK